MVCVDESLWRFLASFLGDNSCFIVGVLSFEACCFSTHTNLCYFLAITPKLDSALSPGSALQQCLSLIQEHCIGGPLPIVVADSAFSSEAVLSWMQENRFPFIVSGNTGWHSAIHQICAVDLDLYSFRSVVDPRGWIRTAYKTSYVTTGSANKKQVEQQLPCITNAFSYRQVQTVSKAPSPAPKATSDTQPQDIAEEVLKLQIALGKSLLTWRKPVLTRLAAKATSCSIDGDLQAQLRNALAIHRRFYKKSKHM